ncbi:MAG: hypothetical protein LUE86_08015 [Clostridiales bacterium]|nr:hypothetical protein [Clostridiales bacterium]
MLTMANGFYVTDNDCMQCCKELGNQRYLLIEAKWLDTCEGDERAKHAESKTDNYTVVGAYMDVSEYSDGEIELAISGFYKDIHEMEKSYGCSVDEMKEIVAECAFENIPDESGHDFVSNVVSWKDAEAIIQDIINAGCLPGHEPHESGDEPDDYPRHNCPDEEHCDIWEKQSCCRLCWHEQFEDLIDDEDFCRDCDPMDI